MVHGFKHFVSTTCGGGVDVVCHTCLRTFNGRTEAGVAALVNRHVRIVHQGDPQKLPSFDLYNGKKKKASNTFDQHYQERELAKKIWESEESHDLD
jgi:hypothetical protein